MVTREEDHNALIAEIKAHFSDVRFGFSRKDFGDRQELWVYLLSNIDRFREVDEFCKTLEGDHKESPFPVSIVAKAWTGPWPGGQSEAELRRRREEFMRRLRDNPIGSGPAPASHAVVPGSPAC